MYSGNKYLVQRRINFPREDNTILSGGLPHSEIVGSKVILTSPTLIAEYHVLHRLLLPRHPPNALFALDLIQKKTGFFRDNRPFDFRLPLIRSILPALPPGSSGRTDLAILRSPG